MYQFVLFDLDGTLTDSAPGIKNAVRYALKQMGSAELPEEVLLKFVGPPLQDSFVEYCGYTKAQAEEGIRIFREYYIPKGQFENNPLPGAADMLARLKEQGVVLALASSKPQQMCDEICRRFGFMPFLKVVCGTPPSQKDWDKGDVIREALRLLGLEEYDQSAVLMVGDRKYDVLGARECGIDCVGVEFFGYASPGELEKSGAVAVVRTVAELEAFILKKNSP